jgi:hypothetical protein
MEMRQRTVKPENIIFSEARSYALPDKSQPVTEDAATAKRFLWKEVRAGDCQMTGIQLQFISPGFFFFDSHIRSSGDDDSWGILHFDVYQANGLRIWSSGAFWSQTIGGPLPWQFTSQFPQYIFDAIALASFTSHC